MSDGTLQQRERNPATFVSEAMTCARELTTPELERIAELTKSSCVAHLNPSNTEGLSYVCKFKACGSRYAQRPAVQFASHAPMAMQA